MYKECTDDIHDQNSFFLKALINIFYNLLPFTCLLVGLVEFYRIGSVLSILLHMHLLLFWFAQEKGFRCSGACEA